MDMQKLINVGLPVVSATLNEVTGNVDATFTRSLTAEEWQLYLRTINPPTWDTVRGIRANLLRDSDWTQLPDAVLTFSEREAWQDYRQALRDIPQNFTDPETVTYPQRPA